MTLRESVYQLSGHKIKSEDIIVLFRAYLDESCTDHQSDYAIVGGVFMAAPRCDALEKSWGSLLSRRGVSHFHALEFHDRSGDFENWGSLKAKRFIEGLDKSLHKNIGRFSIAINKKAHAEVKKAMRGVKNFTADCDAGLGFRIGVHGICTAIKKHYPHSKASFIVEEGPWSGNAYAVYQRMAGSLGNPRGSKHAAMLAGFIPLPKRTVRALEAADYVADLARQDMLKYGTLKDHGNHIFKVMADQKYLKNLYETMMAETQRRKEYGQRKSKAASS